MSETGENKQSEDDTVFEDSEESGNVEDADTEEDGDGLQKDEPRLFECICDFKAEQEEDLSIALGDILTILSTREDGWWEAENENGSKGLVPSTFLKPKQPDDDTEIDIGAGDLQRIEAGGMQKRNSLWQTLRNAVRKSPMLDILASLSIIPPTFRNSALAILLGNGQYKFSSFVSPTLCASQLAFRDLFWDSASGGLRPRNTKIQKIVAVVSGRSIPCVGQGVETVGQHLRICLYDGNSVISNVHTVQSQVNSRDLRQWDFTTKGNSSIEESEFFVRSTSASTSLQLLIELCITCKRTNSDEDVELCCGWVKLPLVDEIGIPVTSGSFRLKVLPGSPFDRTDDGERAITNPKENLIQQRRQHPTLILKLRSPSSTTKSQLDFLPDELIGPITWAPLLVLYRQIVADALLRDRIRFNSCEPIHSPFLANFAMCTDNPDVMDTLKTAWTNKMKSEKRALKRDVQFMKRTVQQIFLETAYIICAAVDLPEYKFGINLNQDRKLLIERVTGPSKNGAVAIMLSDQIQQKPFDLREVSFDAFSPR